MTGRYYLYNGPFKTKEEAEERVSTLNPDPIYLWYVQFDDSWYGEEKWMVVGRSKSVFD